MSSALLKTSVNLPLGSAPRFQQRLAPPRNATLGCSDKGGRTGRGVAGGRAGSRAAPSSPQAPRVSPPSLTGPRARSVSPPDGKAAAASGGVGTPPAPGPPVSRPEPAPTLLGPRGVATHSPAPVLPTPSAPSGLLREPSPSVRVVVVVVGPPHWTPNRPHGRPLPHIPPSGLACDGAGGSLRLSPPLGPSWTRHSSWGGGGHGAEGRRRGLLGPLPAVPGRRLELV